MPQQPERPPGRLTAWARGGQTAWGGWARRARPGTLPPLVRGPRGPPRSEPCSSAIDAKGRAGATRSTRCGRGPADGTSCAPDKTAWWSLTKRNPFLGIDPLSLANQAVAFARMSGSSFSRRSSRFSARTSLRRPSSEPSPRSPSSRSACSTQRRIAVADGSNSFGRRSGLRPARTSSTIRALNSGAYLRPLPAMVTPPRWRPALD